MIRPADAHRAPHDQDALVATAPRASRFSATACRVEAAIHDLVRDQELLGGSILTSRPGSVLTSAAALRRIAVGRKAWLFVGSDDHAQAAGNLLTLIASARLHRLDPEAYLRDLFRVLPHWPRERFLELCPRDWPATRARLDAVELDRELGALTIPPSAAEQPATR